MSLTYDGCLRFREGLLDMLHNKEYTKGFMFLSVSYTIIIS